MKHLTGFLAAASMALVLPAAPAHAGGDITNFTVENCTQERLFVCSFDKTDSLLKVPYKSGRVQPKNKKEFGCASLNKCKVIIGVSSKTRETTFTPGDNEPEDQIIGSVGAAVAVMGVLVVAGGVVALPVGLVGGVIISAAVGGAIGALEVHDGWSDGEVCNRVRKAAQKAGIKPKFFMKNGKSYQVVEQYAADANGKVYVTADGMALRAYTAEQGKGKCPAPLAQLPVLK